MYVVCVTSWVKPEHVDDYINACMENTRETRKEPGNVRFDLLRSVEPDNQFFFYEVYHAEEDFHKHHETDHYLRWRDTVTPWMEKPRSAAKYSSIAPAEAGQW